MTFNQIQYLKYLEDVRSHQEGERATRARDRETARHNVETESHNVRMLGETTRSNLAREAETARSNLAKEQETRRSNLARESETLRSNKESERIQEQHFQRSDAVQRGSLDEQIRMNKSTEQYRIQQLQLGQMTLNEQQRHSQVVEAETYRANVAREKFNELSLRSSEQIAREQMANQVRVANINAAVGHAQVALGYQNLAEATRSNLARESENTRSNLAREKENTRTNKAREKTERQKVLAQNTRNRHDYQYQQESLELQRRGQNVSAGSAIATAGINAGSRLIPFMFMGG